jgi:hypothetical protein
MNLLPEKDRRWAACPDHGRNTSVDDGRLCRLPAAGNRRQDQNHRIKPECHVWCTEAGIQTKSVYMILLAPGVTVVPVKEHRGPSNSG